MKPILPALIAALLFSGASAAPPVQVSGMVADEASKAAILKRLHDLYGAGRVVDQLSVGKVATPANWNSHLGKLIGPNLQAITKGQLKVDGTAVTVQGEVASEEQRQRVGADLTASLNPTFTVRNDLRVAASGQHVLDAALADRIIEFDSGAATLTPAGKAILEQMSVALAKVHGKQVRLIGHTDNAGARGRNLALSRARAQAVRSYLMAQGIDGSSMSVAGEGPDRPLASNDSAQGRARNRRIEFKIVP